MIAYPNPADLVPRPYRYAEELVEEGRFDLELLNEVMIHNRDDRYFGHPEVLVYRPAGL